MDYIVYVLLASEILLWAYAWIVKVARILNGNLISLLGLVVAIALLNEFSSDTYCTNEAGVIVKSGS